MEWNEETEWAGEEEGAGVGACEGAGEEECRRRVGVGAG